MASAGLLGLASMPHCAAMCAAPCALASGPGRGGSVAFQSGRLASYGAAGAMAGAAAGALAQLASWAPALRPLWTLVQVAALALGMWLLWRGRQPRWLAQWRAPNPHAAGAGLLWAAWPCGMLHSALLLAALSGSALAGGLAMLLFALASSPGLWAAPWLRRQVLRRYPARSAALDSGAVRAAGALVAGGAVFALGHGLWGPLAALCGLG